MWCWLLAAIEPLGYDGAPHIELWGLLWLLNPQLSAEEADSGIKDGELRNPLPAVDFSELSDTGAESNIAGGDELGPVAIKLLGRNALAALAVLLGCRYVAELTRCVLLFIKRMFLKS